jgi:hypothetical protein
MIYDMRKACQAGEHLLDEQDPGWELRASPATLDMAFHGLCLLSQLYGSFPDGIERLDLGDLFGEEVQDWMGWEYGFTLPPTSLASMSEASVLYARLTEEWRNIITQKRGESPDPTQLPLSKALTLAEALTLLAALVDTHGGELRVDLTLRRHRTVSIEREQLAAALLARDQRSFLCIDLHCPQVGAVLSAPPDSPEDPHHLGRPCALWPLTPPPGVEIAPAEVEQYIQALLDELNYGSGDSPYTPEARWDLSP